VVEVAWGMAELLLLDTMAEGVVRVEVGGLSSIQEPIRIPSSQRRPFTLKTSECLSKCSIKVVQYISWSISLLVATEID
jgi:hypothetical protein